MKAFYVKLCRVLVITMMLTRVAFSEEIQTIKPLVHSSAFGRVFECTAKIVVIKDELFALIEKPQEGEDSKQIKIKLTAFETTTLNIIKKQENKIITFHCYEKIRCVGHPNDFAEYTPSGIGIKTHSFRIENYLVALNASTKDAYINQKQE